MHLINRLDEVKGATMAWKSNLTHLSIGDAGLTLESSSELRQRVTELSDQVKRLDQEIKRLANQTVQLQDMSRYYQREMNQLQLSVFDANQVENI